MDAGEQHKFLEKVLQQLKVIHARCAEQREWTETVCRSGKSLFRPWPTKLKKETATNSTNGEPSRQPPVPDSVSANPVVDPEVALVEKALIKAQKARNFLAKLQKTDDELAKTVKQDSFMTLSEPVTESSEHDKHISGSRTQSNFKNQTKLLTGVKKPDQTTQSQDKDVGVISKRDLDDLLNSRTKPSNKPKPTSSRPAARRPTSGQKPVYTRAPFKTQAPVPAIGRSRQNVTSSKATNLRTTSSKAQGQNPVISEAKGSDVINGSGDVSATHKSEPVDQSWLTKQEKTTQNMFQDTSDNAHKGIGKGSQSLVPEFGKLSVKEETEAPPFCLSTQGNKLSLPSKLQRLSAANQRLRSKLKTASLRKKVTAAKSTSSFTAETFCNRLQTVLSEETVAEADGDRLLEMLRQSAIYRNLLCLLTSVCSQPLTEDTPWQEILRRRKLLEMVLTTFTDLEEQYRQVITDNGAKTISSGKYKLSRPAVPCNGYIWLNSKEGELQPFVATLQSAVSRLHYRSLPQLQLYTAAVHQVQVLKLQLTILDLLETESLKFLKTLDVSQRGATTIYRSLYSMLSCGGRIFPALIQDTSEDMEETDVNDF